MLDVIIVGAGPAGLNAALVLGRCRREVLLCDSGRPRNARSRHVNGFITRDGCRPSDIHRIGRRELKAYSSVEMREIEVVDAEPIARKRAFRVTLDGGEQIEARKVLLATGLVDELPDVEGFAELWGSGAHHCPYCDGWEHRDEPIAVYGSGHKILGFALEMTAWTRDIILCTDGPAKLSRTDRARLERQEIGLEERPILRLEGNAEGGLEGIRFRDGEVLARKAVFFNPVESKPSPLVGRLGCELTEKGVVETHGYEKTNVPGLFAAGDSSRRVQFAIVAAAEGAMAAFAINTELLKEDLR